MRRKINTCRQTARDLTDIMCLNWSYLKISPEVSRWTTNRLYLLDWHYGEPIESQHDLREALLKIPPPSSRAPADGGFPLLRETRRLDHADSRECAAGARADGLGVKQQTGWLFHYPTSYLTAGQKDGKGWTPTHSSWTERETWRLKKFRSLDSLCCLRTKWQKRRLSPEEVKTFLGICLFR